MSNTTSIFGASYGNGVIPFFHKDENGNIISKQVTGRTYTIKESVIVLEEFPDLQYEFDITISNLNGKSFSNTDISVDKKLARVEKNYLLLNENEYIVDITTGFVHFHPNLNGVGIKVGDYYGKGLWLIDDTRIIADIIKKRNADGTYSYDYRNLADTIASSKGFVSKGEWSSEETYEINNIVVHNEVIYIAKKSGNKGEEPFTPKQNGEASEYWDVVIDVNGIITDNIEKVNESIEGVLSELEEHKELRGTDTVFGHVKLSDSIDSEDGNDIFYGVAATSYAVGSLRRKLSADIEEVAKEFEKHESDYTSSTSDKPGHVLLSDTTVLSGTNKDDYTAPSLYCINKMQNDIQNDINNKADKINANGGFEGGKGAVCKSGAAIGWEASAERGGAIGSVTYAEDGGAVGYGAIASQGFSGGMDAKTFDSRGVIIDAIQLGTGTNSNEKTLQVYDYQLMDANGNIPVERLSVSTNDQTPTYTEAITVAELTSGEKLSTAFGKISKAISEFIKHRTQAPDSGGAKLGHVQLTHNPTYTGGSSAEEYTAASGICANILYQSIEDNKAEINKRPIANIKKNPSDTTGDIVEGHLTVLGSFVSGDAEDKNEASGTYSFAGGGYSNEATAPYSFIGGGGANRIDPLCRNSIILGGSGNTIEDDDSSLPYGAIVGGSSNRIVGEGANSVILGGRNNVIMNFGTAESSAIVGGYYARANDHNIAIGRYNIDPEGGNPSGAGGDVFVVGIGDSTARKNGFRVAYDGNCYAATAMNSTGADYAECFEWVDGNTENEDRVGLMTAFEGTKIRLANENDPIEIIGVVSAIPAVVGDNYADEWQGKYLKDKYGRLLTEHRVYEDEFDEDGNLIRKAYEADEYVLNPDYNFDEEYIPRLERKEYSAVGTHGKLVVRDDGTCEVGGFCRSGNGGIATKSDSGFYVMERIDEETVRVYIK